MSMWLLWRPGEALHLFVGMVAEYQKRISGPLLDRIDIHIEVPRVEYEKLSDRRKGELPEAIQRCVEAACQIERFSAWADSLANQADLRPGDLITRIGDFTIDENHSYINALFQHKPGDQVTVVVVRNVYGIQGQVILGETNPS